MSNSTKSLLLLLVASVCLLVLLVSFRDPPQNPCSPKKALDTDRTNAQPGPFPRPQVDRPQETRQIQVTRDVAETQAGTCAVSLVDDAGAPVPNLSVRWRCTGGNFKAIKGSSTSDGSGCFSVEVLRPGQLSLECPDEHWLLPPDHGVPEEGHTLVIQATRAVMVKLLILGANDEPFTGDASAREAVAEGRPCRFTQELLFNGTDPVPMTRIPVGCAIRVHVRASMLGYEAQTRFISHAELIDGRTVLLKLSPSNGYSDGILELDLSGWQGLASSVEVSELGCQAGAMSGGPDRFVSKTLWRSRPGRPGSYIVRISGRPNWESTPIEITAGETTRVTPDLYLPCQITIRILDSAGQPLPGAVLTRRTRPYVFYGFRGDGPAVESGMQNIAGQDGCVALSEMRAGKHRFLVEANGYDPQTLEFDLTAGELRDGGIVYLSKAKCRVVVKLKGMRENQAYTVAVGQPLGNLVRFAKLTTDSELVFENLPARPYLITVVAGTGGKPATAELNPTAQSPEAAVEIDVSMLEPKHRK